MRWKFPLLPRGSLDIPQTGGTWTTVSTVCTLLRIQQMPPLDHRENTTPHCFCGRLPSHSALPSSFGTGYGTCLLPIMAPESKPYTNISSHTLLSWCILAASLRILLKTNCLQVGELPDFLFPSSKKKAALVLSFQNSVAMNKDDRVPWQLRFCWGLI